MNGVTSMDQVIIRRLTEIIHANLEIENFGVNELAAAAGMSRSSVHRRLKIFTGKSASQFIREVRLQKAMEMLRHDMVTVAEISYKVGFNSPTYFNTCFHQFFGYPPGEVKKRCFNGNNPDSESTFTLPDDLKQPIAVVPPAKVHYIRFTRGTFLSLAVIVVILLSLIIYWNISLIKNGRIFNVSRLNARDKSIVVLPFKNLSGNPENQYFADGVMEDILNHLFRIRELRVISRTTAEHYRGGSRAAPEIAKELGVNFILEGSVRYESGKVRIGVQLIDARHDHHIWAEIYDRELADVFIIQSSIARQIADELQAVLTSNEIEHIEKIQTQNPEAYNLYLKGRFFWNRMTQEGVKKSIEYYQMAIATDSKYALPYAGLADAYFMQAWWGWSSGRACYCKAREFAIRALELDHNLAPAHATLGAVMCWCDWDWGKGEQEFIRAIELNPAYVSVHQYYSEFLDMIGKNNEARSQINFAIKLDPFSSSLYLLSALYYYNEGKFSEALSDCRKLDELDADSSLTNWRYFGIYFRTGEKLMATDRLLKIVAENFPKIKANGLTPDIDKKADIKELLCLIINLELEEKDPEFVTLARLNALAGRNQVALEWLGKALQKRLPDLPKILNDADFKNLRGEPTFSLIIKQMGLSGYLHKMVAAPR